MIGILAVALLVSSSGSAVELQQQAASRLEVIMEETFSGITGHLKEGSPVDEQGVRASVAAAFARDGLVSDEPPLVAVGIHSADPGWDGSGNLPIRKGDFLLLELSAREDTPGALYADLTWVAFAGSARQIPPRIQKVWGMVREARDHALAELKAHPHAPGGSIDDAARMVVVKHNHGPWFPHATGHSLGEKDRGDGPNLQRGETRTLEDGQCVTVEPGIYYPAEFGVRSGVDVCIGEDGARVSGKLLQREIRALLE